MYKIAVSPEQLEDFAFRIERFKKTIMFECECLQQQADAIRPFVDETTGRALAYHIKEIISIVAHKENALKELINSAYAYAGIVRNIQQKLMAEKECQNTLKEKACGIACYVVMHEHIKAADSEYQTMDGYIADRAKSIIDVATTAVDTVTGVAFKPQLVPTDEAQIEDQVDNVIKLIDGQIARHNPQKVIDRSETTIPQEQIDSHTLVINAANETQKFSNKDQSDGYENQQ